MFVGSIDTDGALLAYNEGNDDVDGKGVMKLDDSLGT
jgi:hypothetical protein